jgi:hypothetical protein
LLNPYPKLQSLDNSVGASKDQVFNIDGKPVPVTILGYYDKINDI